MGYNKKILSQATAGLNKAKAPAKKKDRVINTVPLISNEGFKQGPPPEGTNYRIPSNTIYNPTPYDILARASTGEERIVYAGDTTPQIFKHATHVDEFQLKKGGQKKSSKKYSRSITATNKLFDKNPLFKKPKSKKKKIFDPNTKHYQDGGSSSVPEIDNAVLQKAISQVASKNSVGINGIPDTNITSFNQIYPEIANAVKERYDELIKESLALKQYGGAPYNHIPFISNEEDGGQYLELTEKEIDEYRKGGWIVEELPQAQDGLTLDEAYARYNKLRNKIIPLKEYNYSDKEQSELDNLEKIINSRLNIVRPNFEVKNRTWIPYPGSGMMTGHLFYDYTPLYKNNKPPVLPTLPRVETPEIILSNYNYTPQKPETIKPETIRTASRSQTVMEPDPNRPGKFRVKELRQVPYSAYFSGEGWLPMNAPQVMYYNPTTEEETTERFQEGGLTKAQKGLEGDQSKRFNYIYKPLHNKILDSAFILNNYESYPLRNQAILENYFFSEPEKNDDRILPPLTPELRELQNKLLSSSDKELDAVLKIDWSKTTSLPKLLTNLPKSVSYADALKYIKHFKTLKDRGYTFQQGGLIKAQRGRQKRNTYLPGAWANTAPDLIEPGQDAFPLSSSTPTIDPFITESRLATDTSREALRTFMKDLYEGNQRLDQQIFSQRPEYFKSLGKSEKVNPVDQLSLFEYNKLVKLNPNYEKELKDQGYFINKNNKRGFVELYPSNEVVQDIIYSTIDQGQSVEQALKQLEKRGYGSANDIKKQLGEESIKKINEAVKQHYAFNPNYIPPYRAGTYAPGVSTDFGKVDTSVNLRDKWKDNDIITLARDKDFIDSFDINNFDVSSPNAKNNPAWNSQVVAKLRSGEWGWKPKTNELVKLSKSEAYKPLSTGRKSVAENLISQAKAPVTGNPFTQMGISAFWDEQEALTNRAKDYGRLGADEWQQKYAPSFQQMQERWQAGKTPVEISEEASYRPKRMFQDNQYYQYGFEQPVGVDPTTGEMMTRNVSPEEYAGQTVYMSPEESEKYNREMLGQNREQFMTSPMYYLPGAIASGALLGPGGLGRAALNYAPIKSLPGLNLGNALNAEFAYQAFKDDGFAEQAYDAALKGDKGEALLNLGLTGLAAQPYARGARSLYNIGKGLSTPGTAQTIATNLPFSAAYKSPIGSGLALQNPTWSSATKEILPGLTSRLNKTLGSTLGEFKLYSRGTQPAVKNPNLLTGSTSTVNQIPGGRYVELPTGRKEYTLPPETVFTDSQLNNYASSAARDTAFPPYIPGYGFSTKGLNEIADAEFKTFSPGWQAQQELSNLATFGKQPLLKRRDFATNEEMMIDKLRNKYKGDLNSLMKEAEAEGISPDAVLERTVRLMEPSERDMLDQSKPFYLPENWSSSNRAALWNQNYGNYRPFSKELNEFGSMGGKAPVSFGESGEFDQSYWDQIKRNEEFLTGDYNMSPETRSKIQSKVSDLYKKGINQGLQQKGFDLENPLRYTGYDAMRTLTPNQYGGELPEAQFGLTKYLAPAARTLSKYITPSVSQLGKYLTTQTPLANAYKVNPFALSENPEVLLHRVQKPGQTEEYIMKHYGKETQPGWGRAFSSDPSDMLYYTNSNVRRDRGYTIDPEILRLKLPKKDIDQFNIYNFNEAQKSKGLGPYAFGSNKPTKEFVLPIQDIIKAEKFGISDLDQLLKEADTFNTPHWWRGYGSNTPKQLPGSSNVVKEFGLSIDELGTKGILKKSKDIEKNVDLGIGNFDHTNLVEYDNGLQLHTYSKPGSKVDDVILVFNPKTNENIAYMRNYKIGDDWKPAPTNQWHIKADMPTADKDLVKFANQELEKIVQVKPIKYEGKTISTDGLRYWNQQQKHGYSAIDDFNKPYVSAAGKDDLFKNLRYSNNDDAFESVRFATRKDATEGAARLENFIKSQGLDYKVIINNDNTLQINLPKLQRAFSIGGMITPPAAIIGAGAMQEQKYGGIFLELDDNEIQNYIDQGYSVDILPKQQTGGLTKALKAASKLDDLILPKQLSLFTDADFIRSGISPNVRNMSGFTMPQIENRLLPEYKNLTEEAFKNSVFSPSGKLHPAPQYARAELYDVFSNPKPQYSMPLNEYVNEFNSRLDILNDIIERNNMSGIPYEVTELTNDGFLRFNSPKGRSSFATRIQPGSFTRENLEEVIDPIYWRNIPGIEMSDTSYGVFGEIANPPRGTNSYRSLNEYLKQQQLGRIKSGFNAQSEAGLKAWERFIRNNEAHGYFEDPNRMYGIFRKEGGKL